MGVTSSESSFSAGRDAGIFCVLTWLQSPVFRAELAMKTKSSVAAYYIGEVLDAAITALEERASESLPDAPAWEDAR